MFTQKHKFNRFFLFARQMRRIRISPVQWQHVLMSYMYSHRQNTRKKVPHEFCDFLTNPKPTTKVRRKKIYNQLLCCLCTSMCTMEIFSRSLILDRIKVYSIFPFLLYALFLFLFLMIIKCGKGMKMEKTTINNGNVGK